MILRSHLQKRSSPTRHRGHTPVLGIDFDGVIADHRPDRDLEATRPRPGARQALEQLWDEGYRLIVWTGRDDLDDVADWLDEYKIPYDHLNDDPEQPTDSRKLVADLYLDDRAVDGRQNWNRLVRTVHERVDRPSRNHRVQHVILTGPSGVGKSYTSRLLSQETGRPIWKLDTDPLWSSSDSITDDPDRYTKGTKAYRRFRKLLKKLVRRALRRRTPSILEGCQFLVAPGTLRGHHVVVLDADEATVIRQRLQRDEAEGKFAKYTYAERQDKARQLYRQLRPLVDALRQLPGVETVTPAKVREWVQSFARRPQQKGRQRTQGKSHHSKNDFAGTRRYQGTGPAQGLLTPQVHGREDTSGEGLGDKLRRIVPSGYYGQERADNWHLPKNQLTSAAASSQGGVRAEGQDHSLVNRLPSQQRRRVLSRTDPVGGLEGLRVDTLRPVEHGCCASQRPGVFAAKGSEGPGRGWVTLMPSETHIYIDTAGHVAAGPEHMTGHPINRLPKKPKPSEEVEPPPPPPPPPPEPEPRIKRPEPDGFVSPAQGHVDNPWHPERIKGDIETLTRRLQDFSRPHAQGDQLRQAVIRSGAVLQAQLTKMEKQREALWNKTEENTKKAQSIYHNSPTYQASGGDRDALTPEEQAQLQALRDDSQRHYATIDALRVKVRETKAEMARKVLDSLKKQMTLPHPAKLEVIYDTTGKSQEKTGYPGEPPNPELKQKVENVLGFLQGIVASNWGGGRHAEDAEPFYLVATQIPADQNQRDFQNRGRLHLTATTDEATIAHEIGHAIEHQFPYAAEAARAFLMKRVGDEPLTNLRKKFGEGYKEHEVGRKDDFAKTFGGDENYAYYAGKQYDSGSTEILSMGIEQLFRNPVRFAKADPEYFHLVVGLLNGRLR